MWELPPLEQWGSDLSAMKFRALVEAVDFTVDKKEPKLEKHAEKLVILSAYLRGGKKKYKQTQNKTPKKKKKRRRLRFTSFLFG